MFGIKVSGTMELCDACALAKGKQKNASKDTATIASKPGERLYVDISSVSAVSIGGSKFMVMIVDDYSRMKWSRFIKSKSELTSVVIPLLKELKSIGKPVSYIRLDNAGENKTLSNEAKQLGINVEFVAPNTPQQNGVAERAIATVVSRSRAMMSSAGLSMELKEKLWAECFNAATILSNMSINSEGECAYQKFYGNEKEPKWFRHLKPFGLIGYAANRVDIVSKLEHRSSKVMFVGYSDDHGGGCYRLYKFETGRIILSRDVRWTNKFFDKSEGMEDDDVISSGTDVDEDVNKSVQNDVIENSSGGVIPTSNIGAVEENTMPPVVQNEGTMSLRSGRVIGSQIDKELCEQHGSKHAGEMQKLIELEQQINDDNLESVDLALVSSLYSTMKEPKMYAQAINSGDSEKWKGAISTEYNNIKNKKVWRVIKRSEMK